MGNSNPALDLEDEGLVVGRNAVMELLRGSRQAECIYIRDSEPGGGQSLARLLALAREAGVPVKQVGAKKLDLMAGGLNHQGVVARAAAFPYSEVEDMFRIAGDEPPFLLIADSIEDPHNLGALIRTAEAAGMHGLIIPKRGGAGMTPIVGRTSAGAVEHLPVARVTNLVNTIDDLKKRGVWIYGADAQPVKGVPSGSWDKTDLTGPLALVIGSEGFGISRLVGEHCDAMISVPMSGKVNSLNASVAAGVLIFEAVRQRRRKQQQQHSKE